MSLYVIEQLPVFSPEKYNKKLISFIKERVIELIYTSYDLEGFAKDCEFYGKPYHWDPERRHILQAELDAIFAILYRIEKDDLIYILDFFNVLKEKELETYKEYKTKKLILHAYDKFSKQKELFE